MHRSARISIGTVVRPGADLAASLEGWPEGMESFQLAWPLKHCGSVPDLEGQGEAVRGAAGAKGAVISALGVYGNPLGEGAAGKEARDGLERAVRAARDFGCDVVGCFAGRVPGVPVPDSIPRFREVFSELARTAEGEGVRLAFENCLQGGTWECGETNIGFHPAAWELMFDAVPSAALGLEWEPCHLICQDIDPMPVLDRFAAKIFHVHGKDGQPGNAELQREANPGGARPEFAVWHRFPGYGITDWAVIFRKLEEAGYAGAVDIEGGHDPILRGKREMEGQGNALAYLLRCRSGGTLPLTPIPSPS